LSDTYSDLTVTDDTDPTTLTAETVLRGGGGNSYLRKVGVTASEQNITSVDDGSKKVQILSLENGFYDSQNRWVGGSAIRLAGVSSGATFTDFSDPQRNFVQSESFGIDYRIFTHGHSTGYLPVTSERPADSTTGLSGGVNNAPLDWLGALQRLNYSPLAYSPSIDTDAFFLKQLSGELRFQQIAGDRYKYEDGNEFYFPGADRELWTFGNWDELNLTAYADNAERFLDSEQSKKGVIGITVHLGGLYQTAPTVQLLWVPARVPVGGVTATATAILSPEVAEIIETDAGAVAHYTIDHIRIDNPGSGYTSPPLVRLSGGSPKSLGHSLVLRSGKRYSKYVSGGGNATAEIGTSSGFDGGKWPAISDEWITATDLPSSGVVPGASELSTETKLAFKTAKTREAAATVVSGAKTTSLKGFLPRELWVDYHPNFMFSERNFGHSFMHAKGLNVNFKMQTRDYHFGPQFSVEYSTKEPEIAPAPDWTETKNWPIDIDSARAELYQGPSVREEREDRVGNATSYQFGDSYSYLWGYQRSVFVSGPDKYDGGNDDYAKDCGREELSASQTFPGGLKQAVTYKVKNEDYVTEGKTKNSDTNITYSLSSIVYQGAQFGATIFGTQTTTELAPVSNNTIGPPVGIPLAGNFNFYPTVNVDLRIGISKFDIKIRTAVVKVKIDPLSLFFGLIKGAFNAVVTRVGAPGWASEVNLNSGIDTTKMESYFNENKYQLATLSDSVKVLVVGNGTKAGVSEIENDVNTKLKAALTEIDNKIAELDTTISEMEAHTAAIDNAATHVNSSLTHISAHALAVST